MPLSRHLLLALAVLACSALPAVAQVCAGAPSFVHYRWQSNVGLELGDAGGGTARNVSAALGAGRGVLFGFGRVTMHFGGEATRAYGVGGNGGADFGLAKDDRLHLCPVFGAQRVLGPNTDATRTTPIGQFVTRIENVHLETDSTILSGGVLLAHIWHDDRLRRFIPTLGLLAVNESTSVTVNGDPDPESSDSFFELRTGIGLVLNDQMALTPTVVVPIGTDLHGTTIQIVATLSFGAP